MDRSVVVNNLTKQYTFTQKSDGIWGNLKSLIAPEKLTITALEKVSFSISQGELVGLIGPNGAGKTTIMKILSGILHPTDGFVQVAGFTPWDRDETYLKKISLVMGQKNQLWWDLPAIETLNLIKVIYALPDRVFQKNLKELTNLLSVEKLLRKQVRKLSLGQRMRLELVAALIHEPEIVFLDEPTVALDVVAQKTLRDFIAKYNKKKKATILLTSHNMDDVADLAKRVIILDNGVIIFDGLLSELTAQYAKKKYIKVILGNRVDREKIEKYAKLEEYDFPNASFSVERAKTKDVAAHILKQLPVEDLTIEEEPIDSIIRQVFSKSRDE